MSRFYRGYMHFRADFSVQYVDFNTASVIYSSLYCFCPFFLSFYSPISQSLSSSALSRFLTCTTIITSMQSIEHCYKHQHEHAHCVVELCVFVRSGTAAFTGRSTGPDSKDTNTSVLFYTYSTPFLFYHIILAFT